MVLSKPGCMIYFDLRPSLEHLSDEELGQLFRAILDFSEYGVVPEMSGMAAFAFSFIRPRLERDADKYENVIVAQRRYAVYVREVKKSGGVPLAFEEWKKENIGGEQPISTDTGRYPTTTTTATATAFSTETASAGKGSAEGETQATAAAITKIMPEIAPMSDEEFDRRRQEQIQRLRGGL